MINLATRYAPEAAEKAVIGGRETVAVYTSLEDEYRAVRKESGFIDYSDYTTIRVSGAGAAEYLDNLCTKDIQFLNIDMLAECLVLNAEGDALGIAWVMNVGDDFLMMTAPESAEDILALMREQLPGEGVTLEEITDQALIGLEGHNSWRIVRDVLDVDVNGMPLRGIQEVTDFAGATLLLARIGRTGEYGYLALGDPETVARYVDACFAYTKDEGLSLRFVGRKAVEICMLETGQPDFRYENREKGNIFELGQQWLVQYEKEEYLGRDRLMATFGGGQERTAVLFTAEETGSLSDGDEVLLGGETVGSVVHTAECPGNGKQIGIALVNHDLAVSGITLSAGSGRTEIVTVSSPVIRPLSWDERIEE